MTPITPPRRRRPSWARALELSLWLGGLLAVAWVGWGWLDARFYQQREERLLEAALAAPLPGEDVVGESRDSGEPLGIPADELAGAAVDAAPSAAGMVATTAVPRETSARPPAGTRTPRAARATATRSSTRALGRIVVPRLGMSVMVADGVDDHTLRRAAGHIPGTSRLGSGGNAGIAGHRDSFFRPLKDIHPGDEVVVTTPGAISRYRVEWAEVVAPEDTSSLRPTAYPALTLVTCHPFYYVGVAPDRFVVRARLIESRASTPADAARLARGR